MLVTRLARIACRTGYCTIPAINLILNQRMIAKDIRNADCRYDIIKYYIFYTWQSSSAVCYLHCVQHGPRGPE